MYVVFVDRDGVINREPGNGLYVSAWDKFEFIPGSIAGLHKLKSKGFKVFVASNQAGVAKGIYSQKELDNITRRMSNQLRKKGVVLDGVYYCTHRDEDGCLCRKPKPGLLKIAVDAAGIKPAISFFIGDSFRDMQAAREFGAKSVLVLSGKEKISNRAIWTFEPDYVFDNLLLASHYLCSHYGHW